MSSKQIKDLLRYLGEVHHRLALAYGRLSREVDAERSRMLLVYLRGREDAAAVHLEEYAEQLGEAQALTWFELGFDEELLPLIAELTLPAGAQGDEIVALACDLEGRLVAELDRLARECPTEATAALLRNLSGLEQARLTRLVHGAHRLDDL